MITMVHCGFPPARSWCSHFGNQEMPSLMALIVVLVATAASALPAESHGWYEGLRTPSGMPCCNDATAVPWRPASTTTRGAKRAWRTERGTRSSTARCCPSPPPMAAIMLAGATRRGDLTFAASSFPAWPPSLPRSGQLESLPGFLFSPKRGLRRKCRSLPWLVTRLRNISAARTFRWHDLVSRSRQKAWV